MEANDINLKINRHTFQEWWDTQAEGVIDYFKEFHLSEEVLKAILIKQRSTAQRAWGQCKKLSLDKYDKD